MWCDVNVWVDVIWCMFSVGCVLKKFCFLLRWWWETVIHIWWITETVFYLCVRWCGDRTEVTL